MCSLCLVLRYFRILGTLRQITTSAFLRPETPLAGAQCSLSTSNATLLFSRFSRYLYGQHHFPELFPGFKIDVRCGGFGEGEGAIDDGLEAAGGHEFHDRAEIVLGPHIGA